MNSALFRSPQHYRTFLTILMTYTLDLVGFSLVFPVLTPLLLTPLLNFFSAGTPETVKTTVLGLLFALFGVAQFIGAPVTGVLADHYGRYRVFLGTIALSVLGYAILVCGVYMHSISWLFVGRILTGFCSGNCALAQSATADLTEPHHRSQAFGILLGVGGLGFVAGPWIGGKLANPLWLSGSGAFLFAMIAALVNFFVVFFFFKETLTKKRKSSQLVSSFKDLRLVFRHQAIGTLLKTNLLFSIGWGFFLIFFPVFLVQKFSLGPNKIGDIFAYMSLIWFFVAMFLNKELVAAFSLRSLVLAGALFSSLGIASFVFSGTLWPYWFLIPIALLGGALGWVNLSSLLSIQTSDSMQGRVMGAAGSTWSVGQILAALIAGPLASWNVYSPLLLGSVCVLCAFFYFLTHDTHPFRK